jgi:hypothetical protein
MVLALMVIVTFQQKTTKQTSFQVIQLFINLKKKYLFAQYSGYRSLSLSQLREEQVSCQNLFPILFEFINVKTNKQTNKQKKPQKTNKQKLKNRGKTAKISIYFSLIIRVVCTDIFVFATATITIPICKLIPSFHYYCRGKYALRSIFAMNTASCI